MTKKEFVREFKEILEDNEITISTTKANVILTEFLDKIPVLLKNEKEINITGFGKFMLVEVAEKKARNPKTGDEVIVPKHSAIRFKPSQKVKEQVK